MHQQLIYEYFNHQIDYLKRLNGGMSNYVYLVSSKQVKYILRIPGEAREVFSDTRLEKEIIDTLSKIDFIDKPLFYDIDTGFKVNYYIEGTPLNNINDKDYSKIANKLKQLHQLPLFSYTYDYLNDLISLENRVKSQDIDYLKIRELWYQQSLLYLVDYPIAPCHNDSQPNNFIQDIDNNIQIIDWELASNNDPLFDIACFGEADFNEALALFYAYYDKPDILSLKRLYLWRVFQCLKWYNGALFKEQYGLSKSLNVDFKVFSLVLLDEAIRIYKEYLKII